MDDEPEKKQYIVKPKPYKVTMFLAHGITFEFKLAARNQDEAKEKAKNEWLNSYKCGPASIKDIEVKQDNSPVRYIF